MMCAIQGRAPLELEGEVSEHNTYYSNRLYSYRLTVCACVECEKSAGVAPAEPVPSLY